MRREGVVKASGSEKERRKCGADTWSNIWGGGCWQAYCFDKMTSHFTFFLKQKTIVLRRKVRIVLIKMLPFRTTRGKLLLLLILFLFA